MAHNAHRHLRTAADRIKPYRHLCLLFILLFLLMEGMWWMFGTETGSLGGHTASIILKYAGDIALILMPLWLIKASWRWTVIIPVWMVTIFFVANLWYFRFWGNLIPASAVTMGGNMDTVLLNSIKGLWRWSDLLPIAISSFLSIWLYTNRQRITATASIPGNWKAAIILCTAGTYILSQSVYSESNRRWQIAELQLSKNLSQITEERITQDIISPLAYYNQNGLTIYCGRMLHESWKAVNILHDLDPAERSSIEQFLQASHSINRSTASASDSIFRPNHAKNIVFIIVESLNSAVINRTVNGHAITPVLNALAEAPGSVSALNIVSQTKEGNSSDGQLIYNTGLLPLQSGVAGISCVPHSRYITLAGLLQRNESVAIFADDGKCWNKTDAFRKYGFTRIHTSSDFQAALTAKGADGAMFEFCSEIIRGLQQPFFMELVTISMHVPFDEPAVECPEWLRNAPEISRNELGYLKMTNYFDTQLGNFIQRLKEMGTWDNTILILASDHSQKFATQDYGNIDNDDIPIAFIAANSGKTEQIRRIAGQVDIFPTILEIAAAQNDCDYSGLGISIFNQHLNSAINIHTHEPQGDKSSRFASHQSQAIEISDKILRGRYFNDL